VKKMRFSLKTLERTYGLETERTLRSITVDIQPRARTYGPECDRELYFHQQSHSSCFPYSRVVLVEIGLIEGFSHIWRTQIV
jgi:hypothetical protein